MSMRSLADVLTCVSLVCIYVNCRGGNCWTTNGAAAVSEKAPFCRTANKNSSDYRPSSLTSSSTSPPRLLSVQSDATTWECHIPTSLGNISLLPSLRDITETSFSALRIICHSSYMSSGQPVPDEALDFHFEHLQLLEIQSCYLQTPGLMLIARLFSDLKKLNIYKGSWTPDNQDFNQSYQQRQVFEQFRQLRNIQISDSEMKNLVSDAFCGNHRLHHLSLINNQLRDCYAGLKNCHNKIHSLRLSENNINRLLPSCFILMRQLSTLDVNANNITAIGSRSLEGLKNLRELRVGNNQISSIEPGAFVHTPLIHTLDLSENLLTLLPESIVASLPQLNALNLSWNQLDNDDRVQLVGAIRLTQLDLSHNQLPRIPYVDDLFSLQALNLSFNRLYLLDGAALSPLVNLVALDVAHNLLRRVWPPLSLPGLLELHLLGNQLEELPSGVLDACQQLHSVYLSDNRLRHVPPALSSLQLLNVLDISGNQLRHAALSGVDGSSVVGAFSSLTFLNMSSNLIWRLSDTDLLPAWNLRVIDLSGNHIEKIAVGTFQKLSALTHALLANNRLKQIGQLFMSVGTLRKLDISFNNIVHFDLAMLPQRLLDLKVTNNNITRIGNHFSIEHSLQLRTLDLSANRLTELRAAALPSELRTLIVANNSISRIRADAFINCSHLNEINLKNNQINTLSDLSLRNNRSIHLEGNPLLCDCSMTWLLDDSVKIVDRKLLTCALSFSTTAKQANERKVVSLSNLGRIQFLCSYQTHCFALCHCCDFDACDCEMACPIGCRCYHDELWNINIVDCSASNLTELPTVIPMDVTDVRLDGNSINSLGKHQLIGRKYMRVLYLNDSNVHAVHNKTFNGLSGLRILHLEENLITKLVGYEFVDLVALRQLFLHNNRISHIGRFVFEPLVQLYELTLHSNRLFSLHNWPFRENIALSFLTIASNPWTCQCEFSERLSKWLQAAGEIIVDLKEVKCHTNNGFVLSLSVETDRNCRLSVEAVRPVAGLTTTGMVVVAGICSVALTLFVILIVFLKRRRVDLARLLNLCGITHHEFVSDDHSTNSNNGFLYDVLISCSANDQAVASALVNELEVGFPAHCCCLVGRDIPVHAQSILQAAVVSRKCVLLVTPAFLGAEWCRFDIKTAHTDPAFSGRRKLIIACERGVERRGKEIEAEMALLMKLHPIVKRDKLGGWSKLRRHLPRARRRLSLINLKSRSDLGLEQMWNNITKCSGALPNSSMVRGRYPIGPIENASATNTTLQTASNTSTIPCFETLMQTEDRGGEKGFLSETIFNYNIDSPQHVYYSISVNNDQQLVTDRQAGMRANYRVENTSSSRYPSQSSLNDMNDRMSANRLSYQTPANTELARPSSAIPPLLGADTECPQLDHHSSGEMRSSSNNIQTVMEYTPSGWLFFSVNRTNSSKHGKGDTYLV